MKGKNHLGKTISLLCMILMLSGLAAGCGNTTGFVSQSGDINAGSAELDAPGQEQDADVQGSTENEQEQASDEEPPADTEQPADTASVEVKEIAITDIGDIAIGQTENAEAGTGCTVFISK